MVTIALYIEGLIIIGCVILINYLNNKYNHEKSEYNSCLGSYTEAQKTISALQNKVADESKQAVLYRQRAMEVEDAVKEGVGVTLRNEVTRVECVFDQTELASMLIGTKFLVKEEFKSTSAVKYYLSLIEKIEKAISAMVKAEEEKNNPKT
jgi:hypothetical protein